MHDYHVIAPSPSLYFCSSLLYSLSLLVLSVSTNLIIHMASKWKKAKLALGLKLCYYVPEASIEADNSPPSPSSERFSDAALLSLPATAACLESEPVESKSRLRLSKSFSRNRSSENTCSICLNKMKPGVGHAIFTAECSHSFHFQCITSNLNHGNQVCPVCRATWKEIPLRSPNCDFDEPGRSRMMTMINRLPPSPLNSGRHVRALSQSSEAAVFDDDESLGQNAVATTAASNAAGNSTRLINIRTYPEFSSVEQAKSCEDFTALIHLRAAIANAFQNSTTRAPIDLVTVLDISGSMAGTKLALLKRAMGFVIQNLSSNDRLSVIAFSSTARRLFPLRCMSETGRQQALLAVNSLVANGGTNIAQGLRKGAKVMEERREKNPVASVILLSDGQDTYTTVNSSSNQTTELNRSDFQIPVHAFGFGADHDASSMHSISEISGGTFSFIETEAAIQDAFAQCIGGLLSVLVQNLQVWIECVHPVIHLQSFKTGSYPGQIIGNRRSGVIDVGDIYADEERDFLVSVNVPTEPSGSSQTPLLKVKCSFTDPLTKESLTFEGEEVQIRRPRSCSGQDKVGSIEVDRQRNRFLAAEAMSRARSMAELGDLGDAISILENCRKMLTGTTSAKCQDRLCIALDAELKEMQERMASRHVYEASGRAYILSGLSSHSWQRATARGDSTDCSSLIQAYQTPSMIDMLTRSQASFVTGPAQTLGRPVWSFIPPKPR